MSSITCPRCRIKPPQTAVFCPRCGQRLSTSDVAAGAVASGSVARRRRWLLPSLALVTAILAMVASSIGTMPRPRPRIAPYSPPWPTAIAPTATVQTPIVHIIGLSVFPYDRQDQSWFACAEFERDAEAPSVPPRLRPTPLGVALPPPNQLWHLAEVSAAAPPYVVLRHEKTGQRVVVWAAQPPANPPVLAPIPLPVPPPPGIGCIDVDALPFGNPPPGAKHQSATWYAHLTGGAFTLDSDIGWYVKDQRLPKPWDKWRVSNVVCRRVGTARGPRVDRYCAIHNDDTGESVKLPIKQGIDLPHDAPIPRTQPAE